MRNHLATVSLIVALALPGFAQRVPPQVGPRVINGQVRLEDRVAPHGVLILLDIAPSASQAATGSGSVAQATTDSGGKFFFDHLEGVGAKQGREFFALTARYPGYKDAVQVVDLTGSPRGYTVLELRRDTSRDTPNVPPAGAGDTLAANQPASSQGREAMGKGEQLLIEKHDPQASIGPFQELLKLEPNYAPGYVLLGTAYMQTHQWVEAQAAFEKAIEKDPNNANAYIGIGAARNQRKNYAGAQNALQHGLALKPGSAEAEYELGLSFWGLGKWQEAEPHVRKAIALNKEYAFPHILMGNIYLRKRDANSALTEFQESLRLDPQGPQADAVRDMMAKIEKAMQQP